MDIVSKFLENAQQVATIVDSVCAPVAKGILQEISDRKEKVARAASPDLFSNSGSSLEEDFLVEEEFLQEEGERKNFVDSLFGDLWWENIFESLSNGFFEETISALLSYHQRGSRGWAEKDVASLDFVLTRTLGEELLYLAKTSMRWPNSEKYPTHDSWVKDLEIHGNSLLNYSSRNEWLDENGQVREYEDIVEENKVLEKKAKQSLRWVATNLTYLWD